MVVRQAVDVFLRRELPGDQDGVFALHAAAFARPGEAIPQEAVLVQALRAAGDIVPQLSIVAEQDGEIVGHVVCSRAIVDGQRSLGLGPLGVHPDRQRRGVGQALMHAVLAAADALGAPAVFFWAIPPTTSGSVSIWRYAPACNRPKRSGGSISKSDASRHGRIPFGERSGTPQP
jgi:predicted N-acetyltransferase YhbS